MKLFYNTIGHLACFEQNKEVLYGFKENIVISIQTIWDCNLADREGILEKGKLR